MPKRFDSETIRKSITLPKYMWLELTEYRYEDRIPTEAEAVRRVFANGLEKLRETRQRRPAIRKGTPNAR